MATAHAALDRKLKTALEGHASPCCRGCFACCYEPVYAYRIEARYMLENLTAEQLQRVKERVFVWMDKMKGQNLGVMQISALDYRTLNVPCPMLENGECVAYERRPVGCRTHVALGPAKDCDMPARKHQLFAKFSDEGMVNLMGEMMVLLVGDELPPQPAHLGVLLAQIMNIAEPDSDLPRYRKGEKEPKMPTGTAYIVIDGCPECCKDLKVFYGVAVMCTTCDFKLMSG